MLPPNLLEEQTNFSAAEVSGNLHFGETSWVQK